MPRKSEVIRNKPRGLDEIRDTLKARNRPKTVLVYDGWKSKNNAAELHGYRHPSAVIHDREYRDSTTGFHTSDAESENNRLKRYRYGQQILSVNELDEYIFYINIGSGMDNVMQGLCVSNGGAFVNKMLV